MTVPPAFFDDGHDGTWLEAISFSPLLNVSDYAGRQLPDGAGLAPALSFHDEDNSHV